MAGHETVESLVAHYGPLALFLGCFLEGESVALTGGVLARRHLLPYWQVAGAITAGAWASDQFFFWLGRRFRTHRFVVRVTRGPKVARLVDRVGNNPAKVAGFFRFIPGLRIIGPITLAHSPLSWLRYAGITACAAVVWAVFYTTMGHIVAEVFSRVFGSIDRTEIVLLIAFVIFVLAAWRSWHHLRVIRKGPDPLN